MDLKSLRLKLTRQALKLCDTLAFIAAQLRIVLFLNRVDSKRDLLTCRLEQPLVLLLVHLVQVIHYFDLHLDCLLPC